MASVPVYHVNLRCNGCQKIIRVLGDTAAQARELAAAAGWTSGRQHVGRGKRTFDACRDCELPEGYT